MIRLLAAVLSRKNPFFHSVQTESRIETLVLPKRKQFSSTSPGPDLPTDATPQKRSVAGGPSRRRRNVSGFRQTFEAQGFGERVARRARTAAPRPRTTPPTSTQSSVSLRRKTTRRSEISYRAPVWASGREGGCSTSGDKSILRIHVYAR